MDMISFHGKQEVKDFYVARVIAHAAADHLVKGVGWENGKGCAIGCVLEAYDHSRYPVELGLPEWLAYLEDTIFEGLPEKDAMTWPQRFLEAVPVGVNVEAVRHKMALRRIDRLIVIQEEAANKNHAHGVTEVIVQTLAALHQVRRCHEAEIGGNVCEIQDTAWSAAWSAAESAAWSAAGSAAESAAESAAWSAAGSAAESAAWSAAWSAAESAAWSAAWSAAGSAAESAAYVQESEDLLELLRECQP